MIKEQNYIKIAEYTKKAFQLFCKRRLASQILQVLGRPKVKKDFVSTESQLGVQNDSVVDSQVQKKMVVEQNEAKTNNMRFTKQTVYMKQNLTETYITNICYGDFVSFEMKGDKEMSRITLVLDQLKLFHNGDLVSNIVVEKKSCFQICSPYTNHKEKGEVITSDSMVCLKNVFNDLYLHLTDSLALNKEFGYAIKFEPYVRKEAIIRLTSCKATDKAIKTDKEIMISSYFNKKLHLTISEQNLDQLSEKSIIASYSPSRFRVLKSKNIDWKGPSYYYLHCPGIKSNVTADYIPFSSMVIRKEYGKLDIDNLTSKKQINYESNLNFYQFGPQRQAKQVHIQEMNEDSLFQIWELQRSQTNEQGYVCRIRNVVTNQPLIPQTQEMSEMPLFSKRNSVLQMKKWQGNEYSIFNQDNISLAAVYDHQKDKYVLSFERDMHYSHISTMGRNSINQFELIELPQYKCHILTHLVKAFYFLKYNYQFFEKWGWIYEQRTQRVKYSLTDLKKGLNLIRQKVRQVLIIIDRTKDLMFTYENHRAMFQDMAQQIHILELFIIYSKIINMKMGSKRDRSSETYFIAHEEFKVIHEKICEILFLLVENNKKNSEIIIEHSQFFNFLLSLYPDTVGALLQESINNLCLLTNKTSKQELFILQWASLIKFLTSPQQLDIQRKFIDILSEVAVDPWDIGITPYQHKIREQLFSRSKKKIFPKFMINKDGAYGIPLICFQYSNFPLLSRFDDNNERKTFELIEFKNYESHLKYICSILKLLRNLCKDRNKKMPKTVEDYGLGQNFLNNIFKHTEVGWVLIVRFLDLYCSMYLIQDPFLSFDKREVKCFLSQKIKYLDFQTKTSLLFKQFTEQNATQEKHKQFDLYIIPLLDHYFREVVQIPIAEKGEHFTVLVTILFSFVNYGYLNQREIRRYVGEVIRQAKRIFSADNYPKKAKNELLRKTLQLCELSEWVCTSIHGMNILKTIYISIEDEKMIPAAKIKGILKCALEDKRKAYEFQKYERKRKLSVGKRSGKYTEQRLQSGFQGELKHLNLEEFGTQLIVTNSLWMNSECQKKIMALLQLVSQRGKHICNFLDEVLILSTQQEQSEFLQYSGIGIAPQNLIYQKNGQSSSSSNRLLNVMKIKELVQKITEEGMNKGDESNKNQKILQLNNLLMKISYNLQAHKKKNYKMFAMCQILLQKLNLHSILIQVLKYQEYKNFQEIINNIINFYCEFIEGNEANLNFMVKYFREFTKRYSFKKLPLLLPQLFMKTKNHQQSFWLVYNNIDKKMENQNKEILFECIYNILKKCPEELFQKIKGTLLYSLTSYKQLRKMIRVEQYYKFPHFIKLLCFVGKGMPATYRMINEIISRSELIEGLKKTQNDYGLKWIYLRLYSFLFIESGVEFDQHEQQLLVQSVFMRQLRYLPPSFRDKAQKMTNQNKERGGKQRTMNEVYDEKLLKSEFNKLMMQSNPNMHASMEEDYLMYLLNVNDVNQFSMLGCLLLVAKNFKISSMELVGTYITQIINFMNRIYVKQDKTFQSKILGYLITINEAICQKYNNLNQSSSKLNYSQAYQLVENFYYKLGQLVRTEKLTLSQILNCAGVGYDELNSSRYKNSGKKLLRQAQFSKLVRKLGEQANNRSLFAEKITEGTIKAFFEHAREKDMDKIDLLSFLSKLLQVLQNEKIRELSQKINEKRSSEDAYQSRSKRKDEQTKNLHSQLITKQIEEFKKVYNLRLSNLMLQKIKSHLNTVLLKYEQNQGEYWQQERISHLFQLLIIGQKSPISTFMIEIIAKKIRKQNILYRIPEKLRDKYIKFVLKKMENPLEDRMIGIIIEIYNRHTEHRQVTVSIENTALKLCEETATLTTYDPQDSDAYLRYLDKSYILYSNCMLKSTFGERIRDSAQKHISALFIKYCHQFFRDQSNIAFNFCAMLLEKMLSIFDSFENVAQTLAKNSEFITENAQIVKKYLKNGIFCTNYKNQKYSKLIYKICELIIKMRARHICFPLIEITREWPFELILSTFKKTYSQQMKKKIEKGLKCKRQQACSLQFCNQRQITVFDSQAIENISSMVIVIQIISELEFSQYPHHQTGNHTVLTLFRDWRKGKTSNLTKDDEKMLEIVQKVHIKANNNETCNIYFSLPMMNKFRKPQFEEELNDEISLFKKQNFFENLDHFSFLVEKELQSHEQGNYGFIQRHYKFITTILQEIFICYLFLLCVFSLFLMNSKPKILMYVLNTIVLILKCFIFARDFRKFLKEKKTLVNISYQKNIMFWKINWIITSFLVIVCYCVIYAYEFIFPVVLLLEAYQIQSFSEMITVSLQAFRNSCIYLSIISVLILSYSFILFGQSYSDSIFNIFIEFQKEIIEYSSINIEADQPQSFPLMKFNPFIIPAFNVVLILGQSVFVSSMVHSLFKNEEQKIKNEESCKICHCMKSWCEERNINYAHHIRKDHSPWTYIYFFIYMRKLEAKGPLFRKIKESIEIQNFQFLRPSFEEMS